MPKLKNVEKRIWDTEGFDVIIRHRDGRDMRGDATGIPQYDQFSRMAKNTMTVADWKANRFAPHYAGFEVDVLDGDGNPVVGHTQLGNLRDTYADERVLTANIVRNMSAAQVLAVSQLTALHLRLRQ